MLGQTARTSVLGLELGASMELGVWNLELFVWALSFPKIEIPAVRLPFLGSLWRRFSRRRRRVRLFLDEQFPERLERVKRKSERLGNVERFLLRFLQRAGDFV